MRKTSAIDYIRYFAPAIVLTLFGFLLAYQFVTPAPPRHITIATGAAIANYYHIGLKYKNILARDKVTLTVKETSGSVENLKDISTPDSGVEVIFMQGGATAGRKVNGLESIGSLYFEPLWIYHRAGLPIRHLSDMRGLRISVGLSGSGTMALSLKLLTLNGVTEENSRILNLAVDEATTQLLEGKIDAAFFVVGYPSEAEQKLFYSTNVKLMSLRRAEAYTRRLNFLSQVKLPEGAIDFTNNIPDADVYMLAPAAQLVVRDDFHPALVDLLLQAAEEVSASGGLFEKPDDFPSPNYLDFPLSDEAKRYYTSGPPLLRRYLPFWLANFLSRMKIMLLPLLALLFPLVKLLPPFYRWRVRSRIFRWYDLLMEIDYQTLHGDISSKKDEFITRLNWIEQEVSKISVPRGFSRELYDMRIHIEMLRGKLITSGANACNDEIAEA